MTTHKYTFSMSGTAYGEGYDRIFQSVTEGIEYLDKNSIEVPLDLRTRARHVGAIKAAGDLSAVTARYHDRVTQALINYFEGGGSIAAPKNAFRVAMVDAFGAAFDMGWVDGGRDMPPEKSALDWLNARVEAELGHIASVFVDAKELRKEEDVDYFSWATARADGYTSAVRAVYNTGVLFAQKGKLLTWNLGRTEKHCSTCSQLNGQRHRASWYIARRYIPRLPGANLECGGYRCDCKLTDRKGNTVTL